MKTFCVHCGVISDDVRCPECSRLMEDYDTGKIYKQKPLNIDEAIEKLHKDFIKIKTAFRNLTGHYFHINGGRK